MPVGCLLGRGRPTHAPGIRWKRLRRCALPSAASSSSEYCEFCRGLPGLSPTWRNAIDAVAGAVPPAEHSLQYLRSRLCRHMVLRRVLRLSTHGILSCPMMGEPARAQTIP